MVCSISNARVKNASIHGRARIGAGSTTDAREEPLTRHRERTLDSKEGMAVPANTRATNPPTAASKCDKRESHTQSQRNLDGVRILEESGGASWC